MERSLKLCLSTLVCIVGGLFQQPVSGFDLPLGFPSFPFFPESILPRSLNVEGRNFTYSPWSSFSECDKICGGGHSERRRNCFDDTGKQVPLNYCEGSSGVSRSAFGTLQRLLKGEDILTDVEKISCNSQICQTSNWSGWSNCSFLCGGGFQSSFRRCLDAEDQTRCNFQHVRNRRCGTQSCFRLSEWSRWSNCTRVCDGGSQSRTRTCVPNFDQSHEAYSSLQTFLYQIHSYSHYRLFSAGGDNFDILISESRRSCRASKQQRQACNVFDCPVCPPTQVFQHCKLCLVRCQRLEGNNYFIVESITDIIFKSLSCNIGCEPGCGCPLHAPYLGSDGKCYTIQQQCPINRPGANTGAFGQGRSFQSTISPITGTLRPTTVPTTATTATTTTTTITTTNPNVDGFAEVAPAGSQTISCAYDVIIPTSPGYSPCVCFGVKVELNCQKDENTSCPFRCLKQR